MTEPERAALDHIRQVVDSVIGATNRPDTLPVEIDASILPVPYVSQLVAGADQSVNTSGAAAGAMLVNAYADKTITLGEFYKQTGQSTDDPLSFAQISDTLSAYGLPVELHTSLKLADLSLILFSGRPVIALVKQTVLQQAGLTPETFSGPHYLVVVGMDVKQAFIHDPLRKDATGQAQGIPWLTFYQAWTQAQDYGRAVLVPRLQLVHRVRVTATQVNVQDWPGDNATPAGIVRMGDLFEVTKQKNGWGKIGEDRWINLSSTTDI